MYQYEAEVIAVVDGDTLDLRVDVGFRHRLEDRFRLYGVNAPEKNTPEGVRAKAFVVQWFKDHPGPYFIDTMKDKREKYGRWLATVRAANGQYLCDDLISSGNAKAYFGVGPKE